MSTTKDKSQGPYRVKERLEFGITSIYVDGPNGFVYTTGAAVPEGLRSAIINDMCRQLNAAYQAGQADRDELVKALQRVEDELHKRYAHPDYEYEHSTTGRKQPDLKGEQLESEGWEEYKFQRDEWTDSRSYRRKKTITPNP